MRYFSAVFVMIFVLSVQSCSHSNVQPELKYQEQALYIDGEFFFDELTIPLVIQLSAAQYDEEGRMLSRNAQITVGEGSILKGVSFESAGGKLYVSSGELRIPIENDEISQRITEILSLFSVREECYHSSESEGDGKTVNYRDGENSVTVKLTSDGMPTSIAAVSDGKRIEVNLRSISVTQ